MRKKKKSQLWLALTLRDGCGGFQSKDAAEETSMKKRLYK